LFASKSKTLGVVDRVPVTLTFLPA
jgi:hypothetical protein